MEIMSKGGDKMPHEKATHAHNSQQKDIRAVNQTTTTRNPTSRRGATEERGAHQREKNQRTCIPTSELLRKVELFPFLFPFVFHVFYASGRGSCLIGDSHAGCIVLARKSGVVARPGVGASSLHLSSVVLPCKTRVRGLDNGPSAVDGMDGGRGKIGRSNDACKTCLVVVLGSSVNGDETVFGSSSAALRSFAFLTRVRIDETYRENGCLALSSTLRCTQGTTHLPSVIAANSSVIPTTTSTSERRSRAHQRGVYRKG